MRATAALMKIPLFMKYFLLLLSLLEAALAQTPDSCVFCEIARGETDASIVYRNDKVIAFLDHAPINPGHTLIIPVQHWENLVDTPAPVARELMTAGQEIGQVFKSAGLQAEAFQLHMNNGQMVQRVKHAHLHVYPRFPGDFPGDSVVRLASQREIASRPELDEIAAKLKRALGLKQLYREFYEDGLKLEPTSATIAGDDSYNDRFQNTLTPEYQQQLRAYLQNYLDKVKATDRDSLPPAEQLNVDTLRWQCEMGLAELEFRTELLPINQFRGFHLLVATWAGGTSAQPFKTVRDYENWLKRLDAFAEWADSAVDRMREGIAGGYVLPKALTQKVIPQLASMTIGPEEKHLFYSPIDNIPAEIAGGERERLARAYADMIRRKIIPTFAKLHAFMLNEYLPASRTTSGISAIPRGRQYYDHLIRYYTTTDLTADEIHEIGLKEVERLLKEMETVKEKVQFNGPLRDFFEHVRTRKELMPFTNAQQVIDNFYAIQTRIEPQLERLFRVTPKTRFEVRRTESFREKSAAAQYMAGSLDGTRPGIFYVPIPQVEKYNLSRDESLYLHEAIPGHHYQVSLQRENASLPEFRRTTVYSVYAEGWALYCESLGEELGLYKDPYQLFGMLSGEMHRAIRLVVDTGLHARGWTREQAIAYSLENGPMPEDRIVSEVERYMAIPGQALSYKIGQLKMLELREQAEKTLGKNFDPREFHEKVLQTGSVPLKLLQSAINRWIAEKSRIP